MLKRFFGDSKKVARAILLGSLSFLIVFLSIFAIVLPLMSSAGFSRTFEMMMVIITLVLIAPPNFINCLLSVFLHLFYLAEAFPLPVERVHTEKGFSAKKQGKSFAKFGWFMSALYNLIHILLFVPLAFIEDFSVVQYVGFNFIVTMFPHRVALIVLIWPVWAFGLSVARLKAQQRVQVEV